MAEVENLAEPNGAILDQPDLSRTDDQELTDLDVSDPVNESISANITATSEEVTKKRPLINDSPECSSSKIPKLSQNDNNDNDGLTCPICLEHWSNGGDHRLTSLKCGHLFGYSCVYKWIKGNQRQNRSCPTCKTKAMLRDLRQIYAGKLVTVDTSEIDEMKKQLEIAEEETNKLKVEIAQNKFKISMYQSKITDLENTVIELGLQQMKGPVVPVEPNWRFSLETNMDIGANNSCRVFAFNKRTERIYVSQQSVNPLFSGYGLRTVDVQRKTLGSFVHLHPKPIRGLCYSNENNMLISVSLDKTVKILNNESVVSTINSPNVLWSCCWDKEERNRFYIGGTAGNIQQYDIRQTSRSICDIKSPDNTPVVSVVHIPGGILTCQLLSIRAYKKEMVHFEGDHLPLEGQFICASHDSNTRKIMISCRPTANFPLSRHIICRLNVNQDFDFVVDHVYEAGRVQTSMTKSTFLEMDTNGSSWIAAANEAEKTVNIWDINKRKLMHNIGTSDLIMDMSGLRISHSLFLTTLSQNRLRLYAASHD